MCEFALQNKCFIGKCYCEDSNKKTRIDYKKRIANIEHMIKRCQSAKHQCICELSNNCKSSKYDCLCRISLDNDCDCTYSGTMYDCSLPRKVMLFCTNITKCKSIMQLCTCDDSQEKCKSIVH